MVAPIDNKNRFENEDLQHYNLKEGDVEKCAASNALKFTFSKHGGERVGTCSVLCTNNYRDLQHPVADLLRN